MAEDTLQIRRLVVGHVFPQVDTGAWLVMFPYIAQWFMLAGLTPVLLGRGSVLYFVASSVAVAAVALIVVLQRDFFAACITGRPAPPPAPSGAPSEWGPEDARLCCAGGWMELSELPDGPVPSFNPLTFKRSFFWLPRGLRFQLVCVPLLLKTFGAPPWLVLGTVVAFYPILWTLFALRQHYYRVAPRRIDLLVASAFANEARCIRSVDLSTASVHCRYDAQVVIVQGGRAPQASLRIGLDKFEQPHEFVQAVFRAALCLSTADHPIAQSMPAHAHVESLVP